MPKQDLPRFANLRTGGLVRPARPPFRSPIVVLVFLAVITPLLIILY